MSFFKDFYRFVSSGSLIEKGDRILLAFSGGADSVCLFHLLRKIQSRISYTISISYVRHFVEGDIKDTGLSESEFNWVKDFSRFYSVKLYYESNFLSSSNLQATARKFRYNFFFRIMKGHSYNKLFLAHHFDDQVETFFLNLFRSGRASTMKSCDRFYGKYFDKKDLDLDTLQFNNLAKNIFNRTGFNNKFLNDKYYNVFRPLLSFDKDQILQYLKINNYDFFDDMSNYSYKYSRNKLRINIIPVLKNNFPDYKIKLLSFFKYNANLEFFFQNYIESVYDDLLIYKNSCEFVFSLSKFSLLSLFLKINFLKFLFKRLSFYNSSICFNYDNASVSEIINKVMNSKKSGTFSVFDIRNFSIFIEYDKLIFEFQKDFLCYSNFIHLYCDMAYLLCRWQYSLYKIGICCFKISELLQFKFFYYNNFQFCDYFIIDKDLIFGQLIIRKSCSSDFIILSNGNHKKLRYLLLDKKIPKRFRKFILVLCDNKQIISVLNPFSREFIWCSKVYKPKEYTKNIILLYVWRENNEK